MKDNNQLYQLMKKVELTHNFDFRKQKVTTIAYEKIPFMYYPSGKICLLANAYIQSLVRNKLSIRNGGSTIKQYAGNISHILRFCEQRNLNFYQINSDLFSSFISQLRNEKDPRYPQHNRRSSNTLITIGRKTLDFLDFVGTLFGFDNFAVDYVGATKKETEVPSGRNNQTKRITYWDHVSFDTPSKKHKRGIIDRDTINKLYEAIHIVTDDKFLIQRKTCLLRLLEITGGRIGEIGQIKVDDIKNAMKENKPMLRLETFKRKEKMSRQIPVLKQDLRVIKRYIDVYRQIKIASTVGLKNDHGYLFINEKDCSPIKSSHLSNEIGLLKRAIQIPHKACAHMFRHRYITKLFIAIIEQYDCKTKYDVQKAMLEIQSIKIELMEYSGHKWMKSLDYYIDLAFAEVNGLNNKINNVMLKSAYEHFDDNVFILHNELINGLSMDIYLERYNELVENRDEDIKRYT